MGVTELLERATDPYERQARLWPALLALLPGIVVFAVGFGARLSSLGSLTATLASCGALYLLANISRELGRRLEPKLYLLWGGMPSVQLLRHRDQTIEPASKARYHAFLSKQVKLPFPDAAAEASDPQAADAIYQSANRWLLAHTRDRKAFALLFKENVTYGFRRNGLGLKPIGLLVSIGSLLWAVGLAGLNGRDLVGTLTNLRADVAIAGVLSLVMILVWTFFFTRGTVRTAAFTYADALLRACDSLGRR